MVLYLFPYSAPFADVRRCTARKFTSVSLCTPAHKKLMIRDMQRRYLFYGEASDAIHLFSLYNAIIHMQRLQKMSTVRMFCPVCVILRDCNFTFVLWKLLQVTTCVPLLPQIVEASEHCSRGIGKCYAQSLREIVILVTRFLFIIIFLPPLVNSATNELS